MKHVLLIFLLLSGKLALSQEKLHFFKSFPVTPCTPLDTNFRSDYYKCMDNKTRLIGVAYSDSTVFIPPKYKDVTLISFSNSCVDNETYFVAENHQGEYTLFHPDGSNPIELPELSSLESFQTLSRLYQKKAPPLLHGTRYVEEQHVHLLLNKTGKLSNNYLRVESLGNFFIGLQEHAADLIDTNLNTIKKLQFQNQFDIEPFDTGKFPFQYEWCAGLDFESYYYREKYDESFVNRLFSVAVITHHLQPSKREAKKGLEETSTKQLIHLPSGKTSYANYLKVYRIVSEKEVYYWALKDTARQSQVFDVYNDQLECLRSVEITLPEKFHEFYSMSNYNDYERYELFSIPGQAQFYLENPEEKLAVLHHNGTRLTDFVWDRKVTYEGLKRDSTPVFMLCTKDTSLFGILVDKHGKPLFGETYATPFSLGGQAFYFFRKHPEIKILSSNFETLIDSVQHFYYADASVLNAESQPSHIYIDQTNRLFIHTSHGISPLYPSFFKEPASRNRVSKLVPLFVDEKGYLISDGKTIIRPYE